MMSSAQRSQTMEDISIQILARVIGGSDVPVTCRQWAELNAAALAKDFAKGAGEHDHNGAASNFIPGLQFACDVNETQGRRKNDDAGEKSWERIRR